MNKKYIIMAVIFAAVLIFLSLSMRWLVGQNNAGYYMIKQSLGSGKMTVIDKPGWFWRGGAKIDKYNMSDTYYFSKNDLDGGSGKDAVAILVRFGGGGTAFVDGSVKYKMPNGIDKVRNLDKKLILHEDFRNYKNIQADLVRQYVAQVLKNTASIMKAEDSYAGRKGEFNSLFDRQLREGIFATTTKQIIAKDAEGNELTETIAEISLGENGLPIIAVESMFKKYGVELLSASIKDIDYDERIDNLIIKKQNAEQAKIIARAQAEQAKQDAITAEQQGLARKATAEAEENVQKIREVTQAKKNKEVAILKAQQKKEVAILEKEEAEYKAQAKIVEKQAEAKANALLVKAGLTPLQKANIDKETKIGVAAELAKVKVPSIVVGGGSNGSNPMDALGIKMLMDINDKISNSKLNK